MGFLLRDGAERQCEREHAVEKCVIIFQPAITTKDNTNG
jgi:hypothetical protein